MKNLLSQFKMVLSDLTKEDKKLIIMAFIALLCLLFSGCEVQASTIVRDYPPTTEYKAYTLSEMSDILSVIYGLDIDLSEYTNITDFNNYISNGNYGIYITKYRSSSSSTDFLPAVFFAKKATSTSNSEAQWRYYYQSSQNKQVLIPYTNYFEYKLYIIDYENKKINSDNYLSSLANKNNIQNFFVNGENLVLSTSGVTREQFFSIDYQTSVFFDFIDWYSGNWWGVSNATQDAYTPLTENPVNKQYHMKVTLDISEDTYLSGDLVIEDDYLSINNLETSNSELEISLHKMAITVDFNNFYKLVFENVYSWDLEPVNQNIKIKYPFDTSDIDSGDHIFFISIKNGDNKSITSELFTFEENIFSIDNFLLQYYTEFKPNFFNNSEDVPPGSGEVDWNDQITVSPSGDNFLLNGLFSGLVGLFVPDSEYFYNEDLENPGLWQRFSVFMQGKLGFLWDVLVFIPNLISTIIDVISSFSETWSITIPDLKVPSMTGVEEVVFLKSFKWSPYDWINQKVEFRNLYELYLDIIDFFVYWGLIWFFVDTVMTVFGNSDTVIDTTYNE